MNTTLSTLWSLILGTTTLGLEEASKIYRKLVVIGCAAIGVILLGWLFNISGFLLWMNYILFFSGLILILLLGLAPFPVAVGAGAGTVFAALQDEDLSQGVVKGIVATYRIVMGILFWYLFIMGILCTWSFQESPWSFFPIAAMGSLLAVMAVHYELQSRWLLTSFVTLYTLAVIAVGVWNTIPKEIKEGVDQENAAPVTRSATHPSAPGVGEIITVVAPPQPQRSRPFKVRNADCVQWWTDTPAADDLAVWLDGEPYTAGYRDARSVEFSSKTGAPHHVYIWRYPKTGRGPNGCNRSSP